MSTLTLAIFQVALIHGPNIPGSYEILLFTALDLASISSHIHNWVLFQLILFSSVAQSCPTLCSPVNCSMPGLPVDHQPVHHQWVYSHLCPSSWWCHPAISSSVIPSSSCPRSLPASGSFPVSQLFAWGGQSTGVSASASVLPVNTQDWSPLGWTSCISLQSKGLSRVFSNTTGCIGIHKRMADLDMRE